MAPPSLLDSVRFTYGPDVVQKAAAFLGDSEASVRRTLDTIIPVTLASIVSKSETDGPESVMVLAREASLLGSSPMTDQFAPGGEAVPAGASGLVRGLFGDRFGAIANAVASFTGGRGATVSGLFGSVVAYTLSLLGGYVRDDRLSAANLSSLLASQKSSIWAAVPAGLNLTSLLGPPARPTPAYAAASAERASRGNPWLLPVLLLLIAGGVAWWLMRSRGPEPVVSAGLDTALRPAPAPTSAPVDSVHDAAVKVALPNGVVLDAWRGGMEDRLVAFLGDGSAQRNENLWFDFVNLNFEPGTAQIVAGTRNEITNLTRILKAFPNARIKIGGFTDSTGSEAANLKLSKDRAEAVAKELRDAGLAGQIAGVEGHGAAFAKRPASAPEADRVRDRRVAVSVWAK